MVAQTMQQSAGGRRSFRPRATGYVCLAGQARHLQPRASLAARGGRANGNVLGIMYSRHFPEVLRG
ncbi:MAG TPA: hypothetical protein VOB72_07165 [Candidatus Dormibacteraeota bacterium]|nr:hypothetical protein [Candidatus Dormibacteraeota bacterium]